MNDESTPFLTADIRKSSSRAEEPSPLDTPSFIVAKRRKSKVLTNRKTNEDLILESHSELMQYVDNVDARVQAIIQTHEAEFLAAYRVHVKKVREEMEIVKRQSMRKAHSEQAHLDRIDTLEKELAIFRQESLKLFEKIIQKDKEIADLSLRLRETQSDSSETKKSLYFLTRRNKELEAAIAKIKQKYEENYVNSNAEVAKFEATTDNRVHELATPLSKQLFEDANSRDTLEKRPFTSAYGIKSKTLSLRVQSNDKLSQNSELDHIKQKLQENLGSSKLVSVDTVLQMLTEGKGRERQGLTYRRDKHSSKIPKNRSASFRAAEDGLGKFRSE
jgi:hypothetical protein